MERYGQEVPDSAARQVAEHHGIGPREREVIVSPPQPDLDDGRVPVLGRVVARSDTPTIRLAHVARGVTGDATGHPALPSKKGRLGDGVRNLAHRVGNAAGGARDMVGNVVRVLHHNASLPPSPYDFDSAYTEYDTSPGGQPRLPIEHQATHRLPPRPLQPHGNGNGVPGPSDMGGAYTLVSGDQPRDITNDPTHTADYAEKTLADPFTPSPSWTSWGDPERTLGDRDRGFHLSGLEPQGSFPPLPAPGFGDAVPAAIGPEQATDVLSDQLASLEDDIRRISEQVIGNVGNVLEDGLAQTYQEFLGIVMQLREIPPQKRSTYLESYNIPSAVLEGDVGLRGVFIERVLNGIPQTIQQEQGRDFSNNRQTLAERMDEVLGNQVPALAGENLDNFIDSVSENLQEKVMGPFREAAARDGLEEVRELFTVRGSNEQFLAAAQRILQIEGPLDELTQSTLEGIRKLMNAPLGDRARVVEQAYLYRFLTLIRRYRGQEAQQPLPIAALALMTFAITPNDFGDYVRFNYENIDTKRFKEKIDSTGREIYVQHDRITPEVIAILSTVDRVLKGIAR